MIGITSKDEAFKEFKTYLNQLKTQNNVTTKIIRSDNDTVFLSKQWEELLNSYGIIKELTVHDTPQQNGLAE